MEITASLLLDKTIAIYGPSRTGKTVITKAVLEKLGDHVGQVLVVAPTEPSNRAYEGFVDAPFIHYRPYMPDPANPKKDDGTKGALRFLEAIWSRQELMAAIHKRANDEKTLELLFKRIPHAARRAALDYIMGVNEKRLLAIRDIEARHAGDPGRRIERTKEANGKFRKMLGLLYKKYITPFYEELWGKDLSEAERYCLTYLEFNPRMLLVFDDCAAQLKPLFVRDIFRRLFYQNRHAYITAVFCMQDDTDLPANLRKNVFVNFFTEANVCRTFFDRAAHGFPKPTRLFIAETVGEVFRGHRKMAYIREDESKRHYYHVTVPYPVPHRFGSAAVHDLVDAVGSSEVPMDRENPYFSSFLMP